MRLDFVSAIGSQFTFDQAFSFARKAGISTEVEDRACEGSLQLRLDALPIGLRDPQYIPR